MSRSHARLSMDRAMANYVPRDASLVGHFAAIDSMIGTINGRLDLLEAIIVELVPAGYGGMVLSTPPAATANIPAGAGNWLPITFYDVVDLAPTRGCTFNDVTGTFLIDPIYTGVWEIIFDAAISHDDINAGRTLNIRFFNVTDGAQVGNKIVWNIGRNQPGTNIGISVLHRFAASETNKEFRLEIGEASTALTTVSWSDLALDIHFTDALKNLTDPNP